MEINNRNYGNVLKYIIPILFFLFLIPLVESPSFLNPDNPNPIGIELNSTSQIYEIFNEKNSYFVDASSGIQITNHYEDYWSHNKIGANFYWGSSKHTYWADDFSWNWDIDTDNSTYANLTGYTNAKWAGHEFDITLEFYLEVNDSEIKITPIFENKKNRNYDKIELIWKIEDIQINMDKEDNYLGFAVNDDNNEIYYLLNETDLNVSINNILDRLFWIKEEKTNQLLDVYFNEYYWKNDINYSLDYVLKAESEIGQYNAPVSLIMDFGAITPDDIITTNFLWHDASPTSFNFEINVYEFDTGTLVCDGEVNSDGFDENTVYYNLEGCELTMETNYAIEILLTNVGDEWKLDYDHMSDHDNDGVSSWNSTYTDSFEDDEDGTFCVEGSVAIGLDCDTSKELVITVSNKPTAGSDIDDIILSGEVQSDKEWGETAILGCKPDGSTAVCIEFCEGAATSSSYGIDEQDNSVTDGTPADGTTINITFIAFPDSDWTDGDKQFLEFFIDSEGGHPETGFMRWNWTIVEAEVGDTEAPIVSLVSPANNTLNTTDNTPDFTFNVTDETATTLNCDLWLDNSTAFPAGNDASVANATDTTITSNTTLANDDYWWWVNCSDSVNTNVSVKYNISINVAVAPKNYSINLSESLSLAESTSRPLNSFREEEITLTASDLIKRIAGFPKSLIESLQITEIITKIQNWMRILIESLNITDLISRLSIIFRTISESINLTDLLSKFRTLPKTIIETLNISDIISKLSDLARTITQSLNITDLLSRGSITFRTVTETLNLTALLDRLQNLFRTLTDSFSITEIITIIQNWVRTLTETLNITDLIDRLSNVFRTLSDSITFIIDLTKTVVPAIEKFVRTLIESINISDLLDRLNILFRTLVQSVNITDLLEKIREIPRTLIETLNLTEIISRLQNLFRTTLETINISSIITRLTSTFRTISETINITEIISRVQNWMRTLVESISFTDLLSRTIVSAEAILKTLTETLNISDLIDRLSISSRTILQGIDITDLIGRLQTLFRTLADSMNITDLILRVQGWMRVLIESLNITELISRLSIISRIITQSINITDIILRVQNWMRTLIETINITDLVSRMQGWMRTLVQSLNITDLLERLSTISRTILETINLTDLLSKFRTLPKTLIEFLNISDFISRVSTIFRTVTETFNLSDLIERLQILSRTIADSISLTDLILRIQNWMRTLTETFNMSDLIGRIFSGTRLIAQEIFLSPLSSPNSEDGVISWWKMDESSGDNVEDFIGSNDGTRYNFTNGWVAGKYGNALEFDGVDDYVDCGDDSSLNFGTKNFSIEAWVKSGASIPGSIFSKRDYHNGPSVEFTAGTGTELYIADSGYVNEAYATSSILINDNKWHHLVGVKTSSTVKVYIDGVEDASADASSVGSLDDINTSYIGVHSSSSGPPSILNFNGTVDNVRIWNKALSADEISNLYNYNGLRRSLPVSRNVDYFRIFLQNFNIIDLISRIQGWYRLLAESINISDILSRLIILFRTIFHPINISDLLSKFRTLPKTILETINITDLVSRLSIILRTVAQSLNLIDLINRLQILFKTLTESLTISDLISRLQNWMRTLAETINITDLISRLGVFFRTAIESMNISDLIDRFRTFPRTLIDSLNIIDSVSRLSIISRTILQSFNITDFITKFSSFFRTIADSFNITELSIRIKTFIRTIFEILNINALIEFFTGVTGRAITVTITAPEEGGYYFEEDLIELNAEANGTVNAWWFNIYNGSGNITFTPPIYINLDEKGYERYVLTVWARAGTYTDSDSVSFLVITRHDAYFYLYLFIFITIFFMIFLGFVKDDYIIVLMAGFLFSVLAINLYVYGFPLFDNIFLERMMLFIFIGSAFYLIILSGYRLMQEAEK